MKIDAPKFEVIGVTAYWARDPCPKNGKYRAVRESDWRKIMAVVKAVDKYWPDATFCAAPDEIYFPLSALRKHLEKRK